MSEHQSGSQPGKGRGARRGGGGRGGSGRRREPAGIERATKTPGAPPRRPRKAPPSVPKPALPADHDVDLPPSVRRQIERQGGSGSREVLIALSVASDALEQEDGAAALPYLEWAKTQASGVAAVREALGVARYLTEDYSGAVRELQAYRRISGKPDQNHLLADCHRALGRDLSDIPALIEAMEGHAPEDRHSEGVIVWASALADRGDIAAGRSVIERRVRELEDGDVDEQRLRLWYVAADLAQQAGDRDTARAYFDRITEVSEDFFDAAQRLEALS